MDAPLHTIFAAIWSNTCLAFRGLFISESYSETIVETITNPIIVLVSVFVVSSLLWIITHAMNKRIKKTREEIIEIDNQIIKGLNEKVSSQDNEIANKNGIIDSFKSKLANSEKSLTEKEIKIKQLQEQLKETNAKLSSKDEEIANLKDEISKYSTERSAKADRDKILEKKDNFLKREEKYLKDGYVQRLKHILVDEYDRDYQKLSEAIDDFNKESDALVALNNLDKFIQNQRTILRKFNRDHYKLDNNSKERNDLKALCQAFVGSLSEKEKAKAREFDLFNTKDYPMRHVYLLLWSFLNDDKDDNHLGRQLTTTYSAEKVSLQGRGDDNPGRIRSYIEKVQMSPKPFGLLYLICVHSLRVVKDK